MEMDASSTGTRVADTAMEGEDGGDNVELEQSRTGMLPARCRLSCLYTPGIPVLYVTCDLPVRPCSFLVLEGRGSEGLGVGARAVCLDE